MTTYRTTGVHPAPPYGGILADIYDYLDHMGIPDFRYRQLLQAFRSGAENFEDMKLLPQTIRARLEDRFGKRPLPLSPLLVRSSAQVEKVLFASQTGARFETVLSHYRAGWTSMCLSSQSGCGLGCTFCATGAMGLMKNLTADEICAQVFHAHWRKRLPDSIAFMGMGEALANPNVFTAIHTLTAKGYGNISARRITVSTVGHAANLERLTAIFPQVTVTLSLHSPFPEQRAVLIPLEKKFSLIDNLAVLDGYIKKHNRKVYLAYLLIAGTNDSAEHLKALIAMVRARYRPELYHISVIRYNTAFGADPAYRQPSPQAVNSFVAQLQAGGINATRRTQFGSGIEAACGQLHTAYSADKKKQHS